jgi:hypothetical protein
MMSDPGTELEPLAERTDEHPRTAAEKIADTLREMSKPEPGAEELQLSLATLAMGLERSIGATLQEAQQSGELDEFVLALTRWAATHRSDHAGQLVVVELPSFTVRPELAKGRTARAKLNLPPGTRLHLLDDAIAAAENASSPL